MRLPVVFALVAGFSATSAMAQVIAGPVSSDLNGDGRAETFTIEAAANPYTQLVIRDTGGAHIIAPDIAWNGPMSSDPWLMLAPNGSVQVVSQNDAIGRHRWELTLTIAYRQDAYRVAGYTYSWYDTLDQSDTGLCDVNLLTGNGEVSLGGGPKQRFTVNSGAPLVSNWSADNFSIPEECSR